LIKNKTLKIALIGILFFSILNIGVVLAAECPTCHGIGKIVCPECKGTGKTASGEELGACSTCLGSGVVEATISNKGATGSASDGTITVTGSFQNKASVGTYGTVVAEVDGSTATYSGSSARTFFPPQENVGVTVTIEGISSNDYRYLTSQPYLRVRAHVEDIDDVACPDCGGTGIAYSQSEDCPYCDGTGFITCPDCDGTGILTEGGTSRQQDDAPSFAFDGALIGVGVVAAAAVVVVLAVKRKKMSEKDLKKLSATEFQNWVIQRFSGKAASVRDSGMGIDGYTSRGDPLHIEQADNVDRNVIERFAAAMGRIKAMNGTIVAFSFSDDAYRGITRARLNYRTEIRMVTVKEIAERKVAALM
jgi:hypothetical protein